jgi:hypothetical protein
VEIWNWSSAPLLRDCARGASESQAPYAPQMVHCPVETTHVSDKKVGCNTPKLVDATEACGVHSSSCLGQQPPIKAEVRLNRFNRTEQRPPLAGR